MKNFILKLRRVGADACLFLVIGLFFYSLFMTLRGVIVSSEAFYAAAKMSLWYNCGAVVVMVFACWLFPRKWLPAKADFIAFSGAGGVGSMLLLGLLVVAAGICAGHFWGGLGLLVLAFYGAFSLLCLWIYLIDKLCCR